MCSFSNISIISSTSQLILQPYRRFTFVTPHSPTLPSIYLRLSSFSNPAFPSSTSQALNLRHLCSFSKLSITSPTSQLILQAFSYFTYVTAHSPTLLSLLLCHRLLTYVTAHSPTFPLLLLRHSSFSNPSVASPTSQLILQPFFPFFYAIGS